MGCHCSTEQVKRVQSVHKIVSNDPVNQTYRHLVLDAPTLAKVVQPGQFIHIKVSAGLEPLFRRPFSVYRAQKGKVEVFYQPVGMGTNILASKKKGDQLDVLGPLGTSFAMPEEGVEQVVMVAGGIGVAPFMLMSDVLKKHKAQKVLLYGGRAKEHTFSMSEFRKNGVKVFTATEDGSVGTKGLVSELFGKIHLSSTTRVYTCGPKPMMAAVAKFALANGLEGAASMEEVMACGLGACLGCSIPTTKGYQTVCHDGPVFAFEELVF